MRVGKTFLELVQQHGPEKAKELVKSGEMVGIDPRNRKERRTLESIIRRARRSALKRSKA